MRVKILQTDKRLGIKAGEIYQASIAGYDHSKFILDSREPDGHDPECAQYKTEVAHWINNQWMIVKGNAFAPECQP